MKLRNIDIVQEENLIVESLSSVHHMEQSAMELIIILKAQRPILPTLQVLLLSSQEVQSKLKVFCLPQLETTIQ